MHYPPGPPHGHGPHGPHYPPQGYPPPQYPGMPPQKSDNTVLYVVIGVIVGVLVLGGGGCLLCVGLAAVASNEGADGSAPQPRGPGDDTPPGFEHTPLAIKLEDALRGNKVPVDTVLCPTDPPSQGSFHCLLETTQGDSADVLVTLGTNGLSYEVPNTAFLNGEKLATTFRGIVGSSNARLRAPCFTGTLMKPVGQDFSCPVLDGANEVGVATVSVLDKDGQIKMSYTGAGASAPSPSPRMPSGNSAGVDGRYECFQLRVVPGPNYTFKTTWVPGALPGFTIGSGAYQTAAGAGAVSVVGSVVSFDGGGYAGWRGAADTNSTGFFLLFRGKDHGNPRVGESARSGDYQCYRQK